MNDSSSRRTRPVKPGVRVVGMFAGSALALIAFLGCGKDEPSTAPNGTLTVSIVSPTEGSVVSTGFQVVAAATGADRVTLALDDTEVGTDSQSPYQWDVSTAGLAPGAHTLRATAFAGDRSVEASVSVTFSPLPPGDAPEIDLLDLDDVRHTLSQYRGSHGIHLTFWASWSAECPPCLQEARQIHAAYASQGLQVLAVAVGSGGGSVAADSTYAEGQAFPFPVLLDRAEDATTAYAVTALPTRVLVDPQGNIQRRLEGYSGDGEISAAEIEAILP